MSRADGITTEPFQALAFGETLTAAQQSELRSSQGITIGESKNLFKRATATDGFFLSPAGVATVDSSFGYSDFIPVESGQTYTGFDGVQGMRFTTFYDSSKNVVSGGSNTSVKTFTVPAGVSFVRVTYNLPSGKLFQFEAASSDTFYLTGDAIANPTGLRIDPGASASSRKSKNLYNFRKTIDGKFIVPSTGAAQNSSIECYSTLIPVSPGVRYLSSSAMTSVAFFDGSYALQPVPPGNNGLNITQFTIPVGSAIRFVIVSLPIATKTTFQLEAAGPSGFATFFEPYGFYNDAVFGPSLPSNGVWSGRSMITIGDSITQNGNWQPVVVASLGVIHTNLGVSGTKVTDTSGSDTTAICRSERIDLIPASAELILAMGGTNDWAQDVALGTISDSGTNTYYGALKTMVNRIVTRCPTARLFLLTPPYARHSFTDPEINNLGLRIQDYGTAMIAVGRLLGIPVWDTCANLGINSVNYTSYYLDGLHPNPGIGGGRLGDFVVKELLNYSRK